MTCLKKRNVQLARILSESSCWCEMHVHNFRKVIKYLPEHIAEFARKAININGREKICEVLWDYGYILDDTGIIAPNNSRVTL